MIEGCLECICDNSKIIIHAYMDEPESKVAIFCSSCKEESEQFNTLEEAKLNWNKMIIKKGK